MPCQLLFCVIKILILLTMLQGAELIGGELQSSKQSLASEHGLDKKDISSIYSTSFGKIKYIKLNDNSPEGNQMWEISAIGIYGNEVKIKTARSPGCYSSFKPVSDLVFTSKVKVLGNIKKIKYPVILICGNNQGKHNKVIFLSQDFIPIGSIDFRSERVNFTKNNNGGYISKINGYIFTIELDLANGPMLLIKKEPNQTSEIHQP